MHPIEHYGILPLRQRAGVVNDWLRHRIQNVLPTLMDETGIDTWIVAGREYNEDPILLTFLPAPMRTARRRTILVFHRPSPGEIEALSICRYGLGALYENAWDPDLEDEWECLARILRDRATRHIGINTSTTWGLADGLTASEWKCLSDALGDDLRHRLVAAEDLAVRWLETRSKPEMDVYPHLAGLAANLIARAFSNEVILPGATTTEDVVWWLREQVQVLGLDAWFHPTVRIQSEGIGWEEMPRERILPGDLLHCDLGVKYLGLCTDTQRHGYVQQIGERGAPEGIVRGMKMANRLQDILASEFRSGRSGNSVLRASLDRARAEGLEGARIYTHPLGAHGHAAGVTIGLWDNQVQVESSGDRPLHPDTCYALELSVTTPVPSWSGRVIRIALEEGIWFDGESVHYLAGRQVRPYLVGGNRPTRYTS